MDAVLYRPEACLPLQSQGLGGYLKKFRSLSRQSREFGKLAFPVFTSPEYRALLLFLSPVLYIKCKSNFEPSELCKFCRAYSQRVTLQTLMWLRLFAHALVALLISALYYDIGNDGAKVLSNLGFLFFNMLFLMYTSMTITILSCESLDFSACLPSDLAFHGRLISKFA